MLHILLALVASAEGEAPLVGGGGSLVQLDILSWNVHWQCGSNYIKGCQANATQRFIELQQKVKADVVVAIELEQTATVPVDLVAAGMGAHWKQISAGCAAVGKGSGDAIALLFDTTQYKVEASGGGCLGGKAGGSYKPDARAFAVALVTPTEKKKVAGCNKLCVIGLHAPHVAITNGSDTVTHVCGADVKESCTVGIGDWNAPVSKEPFCNYTVADRWEQLVSASASASVSAAQAQAQAQALEVPEAPEAPPLGCMKCCDEPLPDGTCCCLVAGCPTIPFPPSCPPAPTPTTPEHTAQSDASSQQHPICSGPCDPPSGIPGTGVWMPYHEVWPPNKTETCVDCTDKNNHNVCSMAGCIPTPPPPPTPYAASLYGVPDLLTCCYPNTKYNGWDDHVVTNIPNAGSSVHVFPYQMSSFSNNTEEHMPIFVSLLLPAAN